MATNDDNPGALKSALPERTLIDIALDQKKQEFAKEGTPFVEVIRGMERNIQPFYDLRQAPAPAQPLRSVTTLPARPDANFDSLDYRLGNHKRTATERPDANLDARDYMVGRQSGRVIPSPAPAPVVPSRRDDGRAATASILPGAQGFRGRPTLGLGMDGRAGVRNILTPLSLSAAAPSAATTQPAAPVAAAAASRSVGPAVRVFPQGDQGIRGLPEADYKTMVADEARRQGVPPALMMALVGRESNWNPSVTSKKGAYGLMQLMEGTAKDLGVDRNDPAQNVRGGVTYLKKMLDRYNGDQRLALAAYNAGPGAVDKYGGVPPYPETQAYVAAILKQLEANKPGLKHGGQVKGYNNSGLVPKMKAKGLRGYAMGGPIGNVMEDTGEDTVDAKVRPGEYLLNPETVATGFGAGDYDKGVRTLNQIVRDATGEEPGPTPVKEAGMRGFQKSGSADESWSEKAKRFFGSGADKVKSAMGGKKRYVTDDYGDSVEVDGGKAGRSINADTSSGAKAEPEKPRTRAQKAGFTVGDDLRKVGKILPSPKTVVKQASEAIRLANTAASRVLPYVAVGNTILDVGSVAANGTAGDTINEFLGDTARIVGGLGGASAGTFLGPVGTAAGGIGGYSLADQGVRAVRRGLGLDERDPSEIIKAKRAEQKPQKAAPAAAGAAPTNTAAQPNAEQGLRDPEKLGLFNPRIAQLAYTVAALRGSPFAAEMLLKQQEQMAEIAKAQAEGGGGGAAGMKAVDDFFQNSRMQPELDSKGNPTGKSVPDAVGQAGLRDRLVEISRAEGIDPYKVGLGGANQLRNEVDMAERLVRAANSKTGASDPRMYAVSPNLEDNRDTVRDERLVPRFRLPEAESAEDQPYGFRRGVTLSDVIDNKGVNTWDWLKAKFSGDLDEANQLVFDTATGEYLPLSEISGDLELMDRYFPEFKRRNMLERRK